MAISMHHPDAADIAYVAAHMRKVDVREIWAAEKIRPEDALDLCVRLSDACYVLRRDDIPVLLFGVEREGLSDSGRVWMLATDDISKVQRFFLRASKSVFNSLTKGYKEVYNYVSCENTVALRWLKWLGFQISEPKAMGPFSMLFHKVTFTR